ALLSRYDQHRRKETCGTRRPRRARWQEVAKDLRREIPTLDRFVLAGGLVALVINLSMGWRWSAAAAVGLPGVVWAVRYYRGVVSCGRRQNLHAVTATLTYGLTAISICAIG